MQSHEGTQSFFLNDNLRGSIGEFRYLRSQSCHFFFVRFAGFLHHSCHELLLCGQLGFDILLSPLRLVGHFPPHFIKLRPPSLQVPIVAVVHFLDLLLGGHLLHLAVEAAHRAPERVDDGADDVMAHLDAGAQGHDELNFGNARQDLGFNGFVQPDELGELPENRLEIILAELISQQRDCFLETDDLGIQLRSGWIVHVYEVLLQLAFHPPSQLIELVSRLLSQVCQHQLGLVVETDLGILLQDGGRHILNGG